MTNSNGACLSGKNQAFCCSKRLEWKNCAWHGKPGNCFDNHCDTGHQVSLTTRSVGGGDDCGIHWERQRSFCCDPADGESSFSPVPLDYLFTQPPQGDLVDTDFVLKVDPTYGGTATHSPFHDDPNNAAFGFFVLTSPEALQTTLDKRDGSHWELFDCFDGKSEEEQTIRMVCTDTSESSSCHKIHLGYGAPGTILEMPEGCGPGKYAVAKSMLISGNQSLPAHLRKRDFAPNATIYDLTFDYDFRRVPPDLGETRMRLDFSNEAGYWQKVVAKAAGSKRKRSLADFEGNHERWLEEPWREDMHGGLDREELHRRWFGPSVIDWLKGLLAGVTNSLDIGSTYKDDFTVVLLNEQYSPCTIKGVKVDAKLDIRAQTHVEVETNFGLTIIATLGERVDLKNSYLYFRNKGEVTARFTLDALATASFDSGNILLLSADRLGVGFSIPGILTVGPNFKFFGQVEGAATVGAHFESNVRLASWDVRQTYPTAGNDWDPYATEKPNRDGTQEILKPDFRYQLSANGYITAHVKPTFTFGIDFNKKLP
jgi:chitinase